MKYFYLLFYLCSTLFAQNYYYQNEIGNFQSASAFTYSHLNFFYITDKNRNELTKIDTAGNIDLTIGGYGRNNDSFDNPVDVFTSSLNVFLTDRNNHRIVILDKDLNYISEINGKNGNVSASNDLAPFGYPISTVVSNMGDFFVLDSENKRIIKFSSSGNYQTEFGNFNSGSYELSNPLYLTLVGNNSIAVLEKNRLVFFDLFGNGIISYNTTVKLNGISSFMGNLYVNTKYKIFQVKLINNNVSLDEIHFDNSQLKDDIIEAMIINDKLFVLTKKGIVIFKNKKG